MIDNSASELIERYGASYKWLVTGFGLCGAFAMVFSATIANVAVPHVMGAFGVGQDRAQWLATAFLATMTVSQLLNHWMVEAFGQRNAYLATIGVFLLGSAVGWFAPNIDVMILGRVLQGFAAGIVTPLVMVTMFSLFPADRRGLAMGIYGAGLVLAPAVGPAVGGMAIDAYDWRFIFLMPIPFCIVGLIGGAAFLPTKTSRGPIPPFDWAGYLSLGGALILLFTATANGIRKGWGSNEIVLMYTGGALLTIVFVLWQLKSRSPLIDFTLWRNRRFTAALLVAFVFGGGNFASSYVIPVFVQTVQGYTATQAGMILMPAGLLLVCVLPITGRIADKLPHHVTIMFGLMCFAVGIGLMTVSDVNTPFWTFALFACISRFGLSFMIPSLSVGALSTLAPEQLSRGSGNVNFIRQLGGAVGTNLIVVWLTFRTGFHSQSLTATQTADNQTSREFLNDVSAHLTQAAVPQELHAPLALDYLGQVLHAQALTHGFKDSFLALAIVFLIAMIPAWLFAKARHS
jgi:EmrB/QacA subfamily drug resistance transporter